MSSIPFPSHYPPGASNYNSFTWVLKPDCTKRLYLVAEFYLNGKESPNWGGRFMGAGVSTAATMID